MDIDRFLHESLQDHIELVDPHTLLMLVSLFVVFWVFAFIMTIGR